MDTYLPIDDALAAMFERDIDELAPTGDDDEIWHVAASYPDDMDDRLPFVYTGRVGGARDRFSDHPVVDIESFAATKGEAESLDEAISTYLLGYPRTVEIGDRRVTLDSVIQTAAQVELPWDESNLRRFASTYQFSVRR